MKNNKEWYSVIMSLMLVGLLLVLTTGIFHIVLKEMFDTRWVWNALKASAWAEAAQEIALWQLKEHGYGFSQDIEHSINDRSVFLSTHFLDSSKFKKAKDIFVSNSFDATASTYDGQLWSYQTQVIPLFYSDEERIYDIWPSIEYMITSGDSWDLVWNILSKDNGITGTGDFSVSTQWSQKDPNTQLYSTEYIDNFLVSNNRNYLILYNSWNQALEYSLSTWGDLFVKPEISIVSSAQIGNYKQNIQTKIENKEFLYSLFSN